MSIKKLSIPKKKLELSIQLPASKSISNRALILRALAKGACELSNLSESDDTFVLRRALNSAGADFDIGAAGTSMRFLTALLAARSGEWTLTGSERMKQRPIKILVDALNSLGAKIEYLEKPGFPPLKIFGTTLSGGAISLDGGVSSQYISALLMLAPTMKNGLSLSLTGKIISQPYIAMTLAMMQDFGVEAAQFGNKIEIAPQEYASRDLAIESDWSAASYWYEMLSIMGEGTVFLSGLYENSLQGDSKVSALFVQLGVNTEFRADGVLLSAVETKAERFDYDFLSEPDLAQTFAVCCCAKNIPFRFTGLQSLKIKETDRIAALIAELQKLGYVLQTDNVGTLSWSGERTRSEKEISIATYDDHRMAMAFAPMAILGDIIIEHPEVVSKSYPSFWEDIEKLL